MGQQQLPASHEKACGAAQFVRLSPRGHQDGVGGCLLSKRKFSFDYIRGGFNTGKIVSTHTWEEASTLR